MKLGPEDLIAIIIAIAISIILVAVVLIPLVLDYELSDKKAEIIGGLITSFIAILSIYIGSKIRKNGKNGNVE